MLVRCLKLHVIKDIVTVTIYYINAPMSQTELLLSRHCKPFTRSRTECGVLSPFACESQWSLGLVSSSSLAQNTVPSPCGLTNHPANLPVCLN